ncbi:AAA family ATPase [Citricoccus sp. NPDC055426]|uniref:helix-turn-helix transcriptional regulator n=1 Tax=Citricoccus sp. NPDC055426 TaxID=3155536 RepID=UPI003432CBBB
MTQHPHAQSESLPGRESELLRLQGALDRVGAGVPQFVAIQGPPGIGKSALVDTFLAGHSTAHHVIELYPTDAEAPGAMVQRMLATVTGSRTARWPSSVEDTVQSVFDALHALESVGGGATTVVVVEDVHWADSFSAEVLWRCAQSLTTGPFLFILTYRPHRSALTEGIERFLASGRHGALVQLGALGVADCRRILRERLGIPVSEDSARRVHTGTDGVPLLVDTVVRWLDSAPPGHRRLQEALASLGSGQEAAERLFTQALESSLGSLCPHVRDTVDLLAVAGGPLHIVQLSGALVALGYPGVPDHGLLDSGQVKVFHDSGTVGWNHPHLATLVAERLPAERQAALHRVLAEVLHGAAALKHGVQAQRLAPEPAATPALIRSLMQAGGEALGRGDGTAAFDHFHQALRLTGDPAALVLALRATVIARSPELILDLRDILAGLPESRAGSAARAWDLLASEDLQGAVDQIRHGLLLPEEDPTQAGLLLLGHALAAAGRTAYATARFDAASGAIDALLTQLVPVRRGFEAMARREPQAMRLVSEARSVEALLSLWTGLRHGDRTRVGQFTEQMTELLGELATVPGTDAVRSAISAVVGSRLRAQGDIAAACRILETTAQGEPGTRDQRVFLETTRSQLAFHQGDWDRALEHATRAVDDCLMLPADSGVRSAYATAALVPLARGEHQAGSQLLRRAADDASASGDVVVCAVAYARALSGVFAGDHQEAVRQFRLMESTRVGWATAGFTTVCLYARSLAEIGQLDRLQALAAHATVGMGSAPDGVLRAVEAAVLGALHRVQSAPEEAREQLEAAVAALDAEPVPYAAGIGPEVPPGGGHALTRAFLALDLARLDGSTGRWAREAADFFLRCGAVPLHQQAEALAAVARTAAMESTAGPSDADTAAEAGIRPLGGTFASMTGPMAGGRADRTPRPFSPPAEAAFRSLALLSTRERQIAVEVAEGKSNREIATDLFLSVRTVEYHVGNCLMKLGKPSRVELRQALRPATLSLLVPVLPGGAPAGGAPGQPDGPAAP